jgi:hypothetical protein
LAGNCVEAEHATDLRGHRRVINRRAAKGAIFPSVYSAAKHRAEAASCCRRQAFVSDALLPDSNNAVLNIPDSWSTCATFVPVSTSGLVATSALPRELVRSVMCTRFPLDTAQRGACYAPWSVITNRRRTIFFVHNLLDFGEEVAVSIDVWALPVQPRLEFYSTVGFM